MASPGATPVTTQFLYEGDEPIADYDGQGRVLRRYINGPGVDQRIEMLEYGPTSTSFISRTTLISNHQGSIIATGQGTSGVRGDVYTYDAYGNIGQSEGSGQPFRFTGRRYDAETGLYYYRARYYSPQLGRFLQTDPIGYEDDLNWYAYVKNDPVNGVDPTGTQACEGVNGTCIEASNFKSKKSDGQTVTQSKNIDDAARKELPGIETQKSPNERVVSFTENEDGSVTTTEATPTDQGERGGTITTKVGIPSNADSIGHSHPNQDSNIVPGPGDDRAVNSGRPNNIVNNGDVVVIEKVNGQFRVRVLTGKLTSGERRQTRRRLNTFQRRSQ